MNSISVTNRSECGIYPIGNQSDPFHIGNVYGGIPTNLITNAIGWTILIILFVLIRNKVLEDLPKISEIFTNTEKNFSRIIQLFFNSSSESEASVNADKSMAENLETGDSNAGPDGESPEVKVTDSVDINSFKERPSPLQREISPTSVTSSVLLDARRRELERQSRAMQSRSVWLWLFQSLTFKDEVMLKLAGPDAVQYLRFQKYLIAFIGLTTVLSICLILPFNFQGTLQGKTTDFGHTTLANLSADSHYLYVHMIVAFILFPIAILFMRSFSEGLNFRDSSMEITRTIQIENIPHDKCSEKLIRMHFCEAYPELRVRDVKIAYDVSKLTSLSLQLKDAKDARKYGEKYRLDHNEDLDVYPVCASRCCYCFCVCCTEKHKVTEFYFDEERRLVREVERQRELSIRTPLGMAFISFSSVNDSKAVFDDHQKSTFWCNSSPKMSSYSTTLRPEKWRVQFAPSPKDIYWENLSDKRRWLSLRLFFSNLCLFLVAIFLTTPEYIVSQINPLINSIFVTEETIKIPSWITDFIPTLLLWSFTALMPVLVAYSVRWLGFWYRSEENHSIMLKTFWYLWIIVLIFPTFGFTTGLALLEQLFGPGQNSTVPGHEHGIIRWECIFLPDSGAFFVNYVITAAFIGSGLELIRFPELFWYLLQVCLSRSEAESRAIQRAVTLEFRFGEQYARMLLLFAMVIMYSISCPLITPFGLIYFVLKHFVDKHNLAFVYAPNKINKSVHRSAINFVIFSVTLLQVFMTSFSFLRSLDGPVSEFTTRTKLSFLLLFFSLMIFSAQIWSSFCKKMSPIKYVDVLFNEVEDEEDQNLMYIPDVLRTCYPHEELDDTPISERYTDVDTINNPDPSYERLN